MGWLGVNAKYFRGSRDHERKSQPDLFHSQLKPAQTLFWYIKKTTVMIY